MRPTHDEPRPANARDMRAYWSQCPHCKVDRGHLCWGRVAFHAVRLSAAGADR